jgi:hypothetical protein
MIQEKYNRQIFDEGTEDAILRLSHMRSNVLSPVGISGEDDVLIIEPDSPALVEWLEEVAAKVTVAKNDEVKNLSGNFSVIISLGKLGETPSVLKSKLGAAGRLV